MSVLWNTDRPAFMERVAKLAGGTTYREPVGGHATKSEHLPDPHAIATALAFSRRGPDDVGPDVAYCWVLQTDAYRERVVRKLSVALRCHEFRGADAHRMTAARAAWEAMVWNRQSARPADANRQYDKMLMVAVSTLYNSAWDSLAEAERRYRDAA